MTGDNAEVQKRRKIGAVNTRVRPVVGPERESFGIYAIERIRVSVALTNGANPSVANG